MTDLVKRLRFSNSNGNLCDEAADRIEELERENLALERAIWRVADKELMQETIEFEIEQARNPK